MIDVEGRTIIVVGDTDSPGDSPSLALFCMPRSGPGNRLRIIMGLTDLHYNAITKCNLCSGEWSMRKARISAKGLVAMYERAVFILLGRKVATAFGLSYLANVDATVRWQGGSSGRLFLAIPHPSSRNRVWNIPDMRERVLKVLAYYIPGVPWGTNTPVSPKDRS